MQRSPKIKTHMAPTTTATHPRFKHDQTVSMQLLKPKTVVNIWPDLTCPSWLLYSNGRYYLESIHECCSVLWHLQVSMEPVWNHCLWNHYTSPPPPTTSLFSHALPHVVYTKTRHEWYFYFYSTIPVLYFYPKCNSPVCLWKADMKPERHERSVTANEWIKTKCWL